MLFPGHLLQWTAQQTGSPLWWHHRKRSSLKWETEWVKAKHAGQAQELSTAVRGPRSRHACHLGQLGERSLHSLAVHGYGAESWGHLHQSVWRAGGEYSQLYSQYCLHDRPAGEHLIASEQALSVSSCACTCWLYQSPWEISSLT